MHICSLNNMYAYLYFATESLKGKSLSEKSTLMAEAWRALDDSEKEKFQSEDVDSDRDGGFIYSKSEKKALF